MAEIYGPDGKTLIGYTMDLEEPAQVSPKNMGELIPIRKPVDEAMEEVRQAREVLTEVQKRFNCDEVIYNDSKRELAEAKNAMRAAVYELERSLYAED